ncbi:MAG: sporulation protein YlmC with PRC-barrel domain [Verrucomicrobiales bacterium]|jgi:sporulation protein YlmC with PRC-barrel domain
MKVKAEDLIGTSLIDSEGAKLGKIRDLLFDDREWQIRYLVVDTGTWLQDRLVLLSPDHAIVTTDAIADGAIPCKLTKAAIEGCPPLEENAPVSRRYEEAVASYYKTSPYWLGSAIWGTSDSTALVPPSPPEQAEHEGTIDEIEHCHVRSANEVIGYAVAGADNESLGGIEHFEIDWVSRQISNIVTKEGGMLTGSQKHDISPDRVQNIDWQKKCIFVRPSALK